LTATGGSLRRRRPCGRDLGRELFSRQCRAHGSSTKLATKVPPTGARPKVFRDKLAMSLSHTSSWPRSFAPHERRQEVVAVLWEPLHPRAFYVLRRRQTSAPSDIRPAVGDTAPPCRPTQERLPVRAFVQTSNLSANCPLFAAIAASSVAMPNPVGTSNVRSYSKSMPRQGNPARRQRRTSMNGGYKPPAACATARNSARPLLIVSSHSLTGSESWTMPAPACTCSRPSWITAVRIAMAVSASPFQPM
jgi:hypothetical protein